MRRNNTEPLKNVLMQYLKVIGADKKLKEIRLKNNWEEIMGKSIALKTEKIYINKGTFFIKISSSVLKYELAMMKHAVIDKLNKTAGENLIKNIKFI